MDNNQRLKALAHAMRLDRADIAKACKAGGYDKASRVKSDHWLRGAGKELNKGPAYTPTGYTDYEPMPDLAFDAFCIGVKHILDDAEKADAVEADHDE
ncbi:hypothetical protein [Halomonas sp. KO116]|uniref:hypothetical protein n=1 Tax=Halomonas sp. KO116 TaxID=1504981 RepID=UPI0004E2C6FE|nr:hypothetical protein [Halomonas sp. KO116]AJY53283.1 hypothetical protein KO116_P200176 [Halomonas sp. KO116]